METVDEPRGLDEGRIVEFDIEEAPLMPEQTHGDTDLGWGDRSWSNDDRLLDDRPPHWA